MKVLGHLPKMLKRGVDGELELCDENAAGAAGAVADGYPQNRQKWFGVP